MTTGAMQGADVEELLTLGRLLEGKGRQLDAIRRTLRARLYASTWEGRDFEAFRAQWENSLAPMLSATAAELQQSSTRVLAEANQQRTASNADGSTAGGLNQRPGPSSRPPEFGGGQQDHTDQWKQLGLFSAIAAGAGRLGDYFGKNANVVGRYTNRWRKVINAGGDIFKYKRSPFLQWGHKVAPILKGVGGVGTAVSVGSSGHQSWEAWQRGDRNEAIDQAGQGISTLLRESPHPVAKLIGYNMVIWSEVGRAAGEIQTETLWRDLSNATPSDYVDAFGEGLKETGKRLWKALW